MKTGAPKRAVFPIKAGDRAPRNGVPESGQAVELLRLEHVSRYFGALHALDDVSFEMSPGELRAVIGQNGAGKTTFFNVISGFLPATSGEIWFDGENIGRRTVVGRVARGIVRTFQITEVFPDLTVFESIRVAVEAATGVNRRPWLPRSAHQALDQQVAEVMDVRRSHKQGVPRRRRVGAWRPARGRNRYDLVYEAAAPAA